MYKRLYYIGIAVYAIMLFFSILFYKERIISPDTSYTFFYILKDTFFSIQHYRFVDMFNQLFPILAIKAGLSLHSVMISYSIGFMAYYFICYWICGSMLKQYDFALIILLLSLLFVSNTFYWPPSQLPQGMALLVLTFAFISNKKMNVTKPLSLFILFLALITVAFSHPLLVFVLLYSIIFFLQNERLFTRKKFLYLTGLLFFAVIILKAVIFKSKYEGHSLGGLKNFVTLFPDYFNLYSNKQFLHNCLTNYFWVPLIFVSVVLVYSYRRAWTKAFFFLSFFLGYLLLVNVSYATAATPSFYIENLYLPLSVFLALPFIFDVLPVLERKKLALPFMVLIMLSGCIKIYAAHNQYTTQLDFERNYLGKYGDRKVIVKAKKTDRDALQMLWATPYEFLLLSELERGKPASIIIDEDPEHRSWADSLKNALLVNWNTIPYNQLNSKYFHFTDTTSGYTFDLNPEL